MSKRLNNTQSIMVKRTIIDNTDKHGKATKSDLEFANILGVSAQTILYWRKKIGVEAKRKLGNGLFNRFKDHTHADLLARIEALESEIFNKKLNAI